MKVVVLAAGLGKRMRPLTEEIPKHLLPVVDKPLLKRLVEDVMKLGFDEICVVVGYKAEEVKRALADMGGSIEFVEQTEQRGTAHALLAASEFLKGEEKFLLIYGDLFVERDSLRKLIEKVSGSGADGGMIVVESERASMFGVVSEERGYFVKVEEKPSNVKRALINAGVYVLPSTVLELVKSIGKSPRGEYELTDALNALAAKGYRLAVVREKAENWLDVGRPRDLLLANFLELRRKVGDYAVIAERATIGNGANIKTAYVGAYSELGANSSLDEVVLLSSCKVGKAASLKSCLLMEGASVGEGARLSYCLLGRRAKVADGESIEGSLDSPTVLI